MEIKECINNFVEQILKSQKQLEHFALVINKKSSDIDKIIDNFGNVFIKVNDLKSNQIDEKSKELFKKLQEICNLYQQAINKCKDEIINYKKGIEFINEFEKQVIVVIYGKVNSGKSALGNFIMGHDINIETKYKQLGSPKVYVYDRGKKSESTRLAELDVNYFKVDSIEATNSIQIFTLGSIAWVDTPGIGSLTKENEELAQKYVDNADLVIFISSSDAAGTRQEFEELIRLNRNGKPVLLVITKSDTYIEDCDENDNLIRRLEAKSPKDRKDVENYIIEEIKKINIKNILNQSKILTISTKLAIDAINSNDQRRFKDSNVHLLYEELIKLMTTEAVNFKHQNPIKRFNSVIDKIIEKINENEKLMHEIINEINLTKQKLKNLNEKIYKQVELECKTSITLLLEDLEQNLLSGSNISSEQLRNNIEEIIKSKLIEILNEEINKILKGFEHKSHIVFSFNIDISMAKKYDYITYKEKYLRRRPPEGFWENICSWFGKKYYEEDYRYRRVSSVIGTNKMEVYNEIIKVFKDNVYNTVNEVVNNLINNYFQHLERFINDFLINKDQTIKVLRQLKFDN